MAKNRKSVGKKGKKGTPAKVTPSKKKEEDVDEVEVEDEPVEENDHKEDDSDDEVVNGAPPAKKSKPGPASKTKAKGKGKGGKGKKSATPAKGKKAVTPKKVASTEDSSSEEEDDTDYVVESILDVHENQDGTKDFFVKWEGFSKKDATWEPEKNLSSCSEKLQAFKKKLDALKNVSEKSLRVERKQTKPYTDSDRNKGVRTSRRFKNHERVTYHGAE